MNPSPTAGSSPLLLVGLCNTGSVYARTRHNVGGDFVDFVAGKLGKSYAVSARSASNYIEYKNSAK